MIQKSKIIIGILLMELRKGYKGKKVTKPIPKGIWKILTTKKNRSRFGTNRIAIFDREIMEHVHKDKLACKILIPSIYGNRYIVLSNTRPQ